MSMYSKDPKSILDTYLWRLGAKGEDDDNLKTLNPRLIYLFILSSLEVGSWIS